MKKIFAIITASIMAVSALASCGTKTENAPDTATQKENGVEGKYIAVAETMSDMWSFHSDGGFELKDDGSAVWNNYGTEYNATWEEAEGNIKLNTDIGEKTAEPYGDKGAYVVKSSDTSYTIFAKEGSEAADPTLYMPDNYKTMIGTWKSDAVEDIFGTDKSDEIPADALTIEINTDETAHVTYNGEDLGTNEWFMMKDWGGVNSEDPKFTVSWTIKDDDISFDFVKDDKFYTFHCAKQ